MAWNDGELFPVGKEFTEAPVGMMARGAECTHDHVVMPVDRSNPGLPTMTQGRCPLHCLDCDSTWWEDAANIKGSPWAAK